MNFLRFLNVFTIDRMLDQSINTDRDRLGHLVRSDDADLFSPLVTFYRHGRCPDLRSVVGLAAAFCREAALGS